ncbi:MAG: nitrogen fixation protein NifQ [Lamprobacter sp.]|uniref:nitrogen fixation protein NifQ n=1 Tax=Lamprobacter sp. TaxID=3100796 RepID=UPI002B2601FC|nr:nitrogen fixation protein NifQ [Lamprobacter sp.]MEA3640375.1 nitrogen fixation protein NifQ [Lamprobacter sp.]
MPPSAPATSAPIVEASTKWVPAAGGCSGSVPETTAERWRHWLLSLAAGHRNDGLLASMLASQCVGLGAMPDYLGLRPEAFNQLIAYHFPALRQTALAQPQRPLDPERTDERDELVRLLLKGSDNGPGNGTSDDKPSQQPELSASYSNLQPSLQQRWMAEIIATGCMGSDHLWQDLGLWNRAELSRLMEQNFPAVAQKNVHDMKWKRFLYKQLCETEGIYTCRSPSCEVCVDYHACFGPEN